MAITTALKTRRTAAQLSKMSGWVRHHPGSTTSPSQQAFETVSRTSHVPHS